MMVAGQTAPRPPSGLGAIVMHTRLQLFYAVLAD